MAANYTNGHLLLNATKVKDDYESIIHDSIIIHGYISDSMHFRPSWHTTPLCPSISATRPSRIHCWIYCQNNARQSGRMAYI